LNEEKRLNGGNAQVDLQRSAPDGEQLPGGKLAKSKIKNLPPRIAY